MAGLAQILLITLITGLISGTVAYVYKVRKVTKKDYKQIDYAKTKRPDVTIGL